MGKMFSVISTKKKYILHAIEYIVDASKSLCFLKGSPKLVLEGKEMFALSNRKSIQIQKCSDRRED